MKNDVGCILDQMQCFCVSLCLREYVCDINLNTLLTVKGGVDPFPIVPPPPLNEGGGFFDTFVCVHVCKSSKAR